jgi:hypothetical protein
MRLLLIAGTAAVALTAAAPAIACEFNSTEASAAKLAAMPVVSVELSAKEKVEYMRSAAGPEPAAKPAKKKKKAAAKKDDKKKDDKK